ncbi:sulfotransferase family protein [Modestobacter italicus]|uniref:sulfotransferase family protein n=1 Tax=Modestobacter italicus (strain DSM 44449 / CECT 9708 / BC 501) TaxID=2732864 RepID=UPI001C9403C5|nr:sulfotransferase [Modestobacter italicus]
MPPTTPAVSSGPPQLQRLFVVGCPRSGTTLLQSFLAAHPGVHSFPETHFFYRLRAGGVRAEQGVISAELAADLPQVAGFLGRPGMSWPVPPTVHGTAEAFVATADEVTLAAGASAWVEKTPANLYAIDLIEQLVPGARFLHILRDGADVVTSLCAVAGGWGSTYSVDQALELWTECVEITAAHRDRPGHHVVSYADLAQHPEPTLRSACDVVRLEYTPAMVDGRATAARGLIKDFEHWKGDNVGPLRYRPRERFAQAFDPATRRRIEERVAAVHLPETVPG